MRIALIGVDGSKVDVAEAVAEFVSQNYADVELLRSTAPDILKVPAAAKRALGEADAAIVFATANAEDERAIDLIHEKIVDVEIATGRYVFLAIVFEDEGRTPEQLGNVALQRIEIELNRCLKSTRGSLEPQATEPASPMPGLDENPPEDTGDPAAPGTGTPTSPGNLF